MGTARELFRSIKVQTQKLSLKYYESQKYLQNREYQLLINSKIKNPYHQLTLCLDMLQVSPTKKYGWILDSCDVDWYDNKPKDWIEHINHRKFVRLSYGREITSALYNERMTILRMPGLTDVANLQFVNDLTLEDCDSISDLSPLHRVRSLSVRYCSAVSNVNGLGNIRNLRLWECKGLTDISGLTNNYKLNIQSCCNIQKHSGFGKVIYLTTDLIGWPSEKRDQLEMKHLDQQYFGDLPSSFNFSVLANLSSVSLQCCHTLTSLEVLSKVKRIEIHSADKLTDISCLSSKTQQLVSLSFCKSLANFKPLDFIRIVHITNCNQFIHGSDVQNVPFLTIYGCPIVDVSMLGTLRLERCNYIETLQGLENIPNIKIIRCSLDSLDGLGNNHRIEFIGGSETTIAFFSKRGTTFDLKKYDVVRNSHASYWEHIFVLLLKQ
jgi:hypothetical protein